MKIPGNLSPKYSNYQFEYERKIWCNHIRSKKQRYVGTRENLRNNGLGIKNWPIIGSFESHVSISFNSDEHLGLCIQASVLFSILKV